MENTISFKEWAEKWWQENYEKDKVTINDIEEVGRRLTMMIKKKSTICMTKLR